MRSMAMTLALLLFLDCFLNEMGVFSVATLPVFSSFTLTVIIVPKSAVVSKYAIRRWSLISSIRVHCFRCLEGTPVASAIPARSLRFEPSASDLMNARTEA